METASARKPENKRKLALGSHWRPLGRGEADLKLRKAGRGYCGPFFWPTVRPVTKILARFAAWIIRTYGLWAARHEPRSFAIYPLVAAIPALIWWLAVGHVAALVLLAVMEALVVLFWSWMLRRRKRFRKRLVSGEADGAAADEPL
jgi:hypothetical protein